MAGNFTKNGAANTIRPWTNKQLDFYIDPSFDSDERADIIKAASNIESYACVTLKKLVRFPSSDTNSVYVRKVSGTTCSSFVGMIGGRQDILLSERCFNNFGTIEHEFLHAIGIYHTQVNISEERVLLELLWMFKIRRHL